MTMFYATCCASSLLLHLAILQRCWCRRSLLKAFRENFESFSWHCHHTSWCSQQKLPSSYLIPTFPTDYSELKHFYPTSLFTIYFWLGVPCFVSNVNWKPSSNLRCLGLGTENFNSYSLKDHMQKVHVSEFTLAVASFKHPSGVISGQVQCPVLGAVQRHNWSHNLPPPLTRPRHLTREPWTVMGMLCRTAVTVTVATVMIMVWVK